MALLTPFPLILRVAEALGNDLGAIGLHTRVEEPAVGLIPLAPFAGPYEEICLEQR